MPKAVQEKYESLPPATQNNARQMFRDDWKWAQGNPGRQKIFAEKWGLPFYHKYTGEAFHGDPDATKKLERDTQEYLSSLSPRELEKVLTANIY